MALVFQRPQSIVTALQVAAAPLQRAASRRWRSAARSVEAEVHEPAPPSYAAGFHDPDRICDVKFRALGSTGLVTSTLSIGGSQLNRLGDPALEQSVLHALQSGVNLIDTSPWYGHGISEKILGKVLRNVPREAFILSTKCGRYEPERPKMFDFRAERVRESVQTSLDSLGLDCIDMLSVHDPEFAPNLDIICQETLPAMQEAKDQGLVRFIGITGYPLSAHKYLLENSPVKIDYAITYCHYTMNDTTIVDHLDMYQSRGIGLINAAPLAMGLLTPQGPPAWHPATPAIKQACREAVVFAQQHGVDITRIAFDFALKCDAFASTVVGMPSVEQFETNFAMYRSCLTPVEEDVRDHIMTHIFGPLKGSETWEGLEVDTYWRKLGRHLQIEKLYSRAARQ